nr:PAS domain-containing protein [Pararoseomonas baculiformis]
MLRESEERQAFLLKLSDALRPVGDPVEIQRTATRSLGEQLEASRVFYVLVEEDGDTATILANYTDGAPDRLGRYSLSAFSSYAAGEWRAGRTASTDDVNADPRWGEAERAAYASVSTRAGFGIPLIKEGRLVALLGVNQSVPRRWTNAERELAREVAERTWDAVERARAEAQLRESEGRFRDFAENSTDVLWIADAGRRRIEYLSPAFERVFGVPRAPILDGSRMVRDLVHPDDRDTFESAWPRAIAGGPAIVHYRTAHPGRGIVHLRDTLFPIRDEVGAVRQVAGIVQDVSDIEAARAALDAEKERFRTLAEGIPPLVWRSCDEGRWTWSSPQWLDYTGQSEAESRGLGWLDVVHPDDRGRTMAAWREAPPHGRLDVEYRVRRASDGTWRWHQTRSVPVRGGPTAEQPGGRIVEWLGTTTDIEDLKRLQAEQGVLVAELQHRTRNLLAVVRNVARRSIPPQPGRDEYDARLAALGRVQDFLARTGRYTVALRNLVEAELQAVGDGGSDRVTVGGPPVDLPGEGAQPVALALHELATNAVKYGAIAQPTGRLSVTWQVEEGDGGPRLHITWRESGVSMPAGPPARRGYGSELITRALPYQMEAETVLEFTADGVQCSIALPARAFRIVEKAAS